MNDLKFALRQLRKNPGFTAVAVLTLALGIGANTAIFSVFDDVLLKPLPYPHPEQLVTLTDQHQKGYIRAASFPNFVDWRDQNNVLSETAAMNNAAYNLAGEGEPERIQAQKVTAGYFPLLGVSPLLGRWFTAEEDRKNGELVAIISHRLWQRRFSGMRDVLGKQIILDEKNYTIVGIMPAGFRSISGTRFLSLDDSRDLWTPLATDTDQSGRGSPFLRVIGRLKEGVSIEAASGGLNAIAHRLADQFPDANAGFGILVAGMKGVLGENARPMLWLLLGAVTLLLLIACVNVANLFLLRAAARSGEMTVRAALGARRSHIVRQLLTESTVVAMTGGALGVGLAWGIVVLIQRILPSGQISTQTAGINPVVLVFTLVTSLGMGLLFGLAPAIHLSKVNLNDALRGTGKGSGGRGRSRLRDSLVVSEVALALILLAGAGLVFKSLGRILRVDPGFRAENVLTMRIHLPGAKYDDPVKIRAFYDDLLSRLSAMPGVDSVGSVSDLPMSGHISTASFLIEGRPAPEGGANYTDVQTATGNYFHTLGIPLLKGRLFGSQDDDRAPFVAVINQQMATQFWPGEDPIDRTILIGGKRYEIAGLVGDVHHFGPSATARPETYLAQRQQDTRSMMLAVRSRSNPIALTRVIRAQITEIDSNLPLSDVRTLEAAVADATSDQRGVVLLLGAFAGLALLLAAVGLYGVIAYSVAQRRREIGIRIALGAQAGHVRRMVMKQGLTLVLAGLVIGVLASLVSGRLLTSLLYEVHANDPATFAIVSGVLVAVALISCLIPARRAARIDPMEALRHE